MAPHRHNVIDTNVILVSFGGMIMIMAWYCGSALFVNNGKDIAAPLTVVSLRKSAVAPVDPAASSVVGPKASNRSDNIDHSSGSTIEAIDATPEFPSGCSSMPETLTNFPRSIYGSVASTWTRYWTSKGGRPPEQPRNVSTCANSLECKELVKKMQLLKATVRTLGMQSPKPGEEPIRTVGYIKTHKTASSTVGGIMMRFGSRHCCKIYTPNGTRPFQHIRDIHEDIGKEDLQTSNIMLQHYSSKGSGVTSWQDVQRYYNQLMIPGYKLVTILRKPIKRYLSFYSYYAEPSGTDFDFFVNHKYQANGQCGEFGLHTDEEVIAFIDKIEENFEVVLVTDRMDESLVVMSLRLNWRLWDITEVPLLDSRSHLGSVRYDGKEIQPSKRPADLTEEQLTKITNMLKNDELLYDAANRLLDKQIQALGESFHVALDHYRLINRQLKDLCTPICARELSNDHLFDFAGDSSTAHLFRDMERMCQWYSLPDYLYERLAVPRGYPKPFGPVDLL